MVHALTPAETRKQIDSYGIDSGAADAFAFKDAADGIAYDWHTHQRHQLAYAFSGTLRIETAGGIFLLAPRQAAWIPAGVEHRTILSCVRIGSVYFQPAMVPFFTDEVRIIDASPLVREMILQSMRWPPDRDPSDSVANAYFTALALLCSEWLREEIPFRLPTARSAEVAAAMEATLLGLDCITMEQAARAAGLSPRQLRRRFMEETALAWREFRTRARILRAIELLVEPSANVTEVSLAVGFESPSAFAKAFTALTGEPPSRFRQQVKSGQYRA